MNKELRDLANKRKALNAAIQKISSPAADDDKAVNNTTHQPAAKKLAIVKSVKPERTVLRQRSNYVAAQG